MTWFYEEFKTLKEALETGYRVQQLKSLSKKINKKTPTRKTEIVEKLVVRLFKDLKKIISTLEPVEINALSEAVHNWHGFYKKDQFHAKYGVYPQGCSEYLGNELNLLSLFFVNGQIPLDLMEKLKIEIPEPRLEKITYHNSLTNSKLTIRKTEYAAMMNLNMLLSMVDENKIKVGKNTGRATAATIKKISSNLYDGDFYFDDQLIPMQSFAWPLLLQSAGLAAINGNSLKLSQKGKTALKKELAQTIKLIFKKWETTKIIDEYSRVTAVKGQKAAKGRAMTSPVHRRPNINIALSCLKPGKWITIDEMARFMISENYTFSMVNYDWKLYFSDPIYGNLDYFDTNSILTLRYLLIYFFEYCATMGILDVAYKHPTGARAEFQSCWGAEDLPFLSHCDGLMQIRLNELGAFVLGTSDNYGMNSVYDFKIQKTDIISTGKTRSVPDQFLYLDKIAEETEAGKWHVSLTSLLNAIKNGEKIKDIQKFIQRITSEKPSEPLEKLLNEAGNRGSAIINKGKSTLLKCHSQAYNHILVDKKLSRLCLPAGDRHIVILPGQEKAFTLRLAALGFVIGNC